MLKISNRPSDHYDSKNSNTVEEELFNRGPRQEESIREGIIDIRDPQQCPNKPEINWLSTLLPAVVTITISVLMSTFMGSSRMMMYTIPMTLAGIVVSVATYMSQVKKYKKTVQENFETDLKYYEDTEQEIIQLRNEQLRIMNESDPETKKCVEIVQNRDEKLWARRPDDTDFGSFRIGSGPVSFKTELSYDKHPIELNRGELWVKPKKLHDEYSLIDNAPVTYDLYNNQICGVVGNHDSVKELISNIILQLATQHSYIELKIILVADAADDEYFKWVKSLPHLNGGVSFYASTPESTNTLLELLCDQLQQRETERSAKKTYGQEEQFLPFLVFIFQQPEYLSKDDIITKYLFYRKNLGVGVIMTARKSAELPSECVDIVELSGHEGDVYNKKDSSKKRHFTIDYVSRKAHGQFCNAIRNLRTNDVNFEQAIPLSYSFFEMLGVKNGDELTDTFLEKRWEKANILKSLAAPIGVKQKGKKQDLDVFQNIHGPHGLIAGVVRSGKSELILSYILSIASSYHPHDVSFFVIDFKSEMPAKMLLIPHMRGLVKDITGSEDGGKRELIRNLKSISAEITYRKQLFNKAGTKNIDEYNRAFPLKDAEHPPIPHLIIIVDEFAQAKQQFPEFIPDLVSACRVGGSFGIHLILATQTPSGQVDQQIDTNSNFRISLRLLDASTSNEVIKHPDAAFIKNVGRAYLYVGGVNTLDQFQSAYCGAPDPITPSLTQMDSVIEWVERYCKKNKIKTLPPLCLPRLQSQICYTKYMDSIEKDLLKVRIGIYDAIDRHEQPDLYLGLSKCNTEIIGASLYGKTNLIQVIIRGLCDRYSPDDVNIYLVGLTTPFYQYYTGLPHIGGIISSYDDEMVSNTFKFLNEEISRRRILLSRKGVSSLLEYRKAGFNDIPYIVLLIDNYSALCSQYFSDEDLLLPILSDGAQLGISIVFTNTQTKGISIQYDSFISKRIALFCNASSSATIEYSNLFGYTKESIDNLPGRCMVKEGDNLYEGQIFLAFEGEREIDRSSRIKDYVKQMMDRYPNNKAKAIPCVPEDLTLCKLYDMPGSVSRRDGFAIGIDYNTITQVALPIKSQFMLALVEKADNHKTNYIKVLLDDISQNMGARTSKVYIIDSDDKLAQYKDLPYVEKYSGDASDIFSVLDIVQSELKVRVSDNDQENQLSAESDIPLLVVIINNSKALNLLAGSAAAMRQYEEISDDYRGRGVMFVFSDIKKTTGGNAMLRKIKEERKALIFDSFKDNIPFFDDYHRNRTSLGATDAFYLNDDKLIRIKLARSGEE